MRYKLNKIIEKNKLIERYKKFKPNDFMMFYKEQLEILKKD
jgi:hypothetical protein